MSRTVLLTDGAARDLDELYAIAYDRDGPAGADRFLDRIQVVFDRLASRAEVGAPLPELARFGMVEHRQLRVEDDRIVFRVRDDEVLIAAIAERGRSLQSLLERRLLDG
jgi:toxin ParE1/3/4